MWHTPDGVRTLEGPEAALARAVIYEMVHDVTLEVDSPQGWSYQVPAYDDLQWRQKLAMLARVGSALLSPDVPPPELTALNEATVAALYECVRQRLGVELEYAANEPEGEFRTCWRELVRATLDEEELTDPETGEVVLSIECDDLDEWELQVECLSDHVLWDADYAMEEEFLDAAPVASRRLKYDLGIPDDYFTDVAPDPGDSEMDGIYEVLKSLTGYDVRIWFNG